MSKKGLCKGCGLARFGFEIAPKLEKSSPRNASRMTSKLPGSGPICKKVLETKWLFLGSKKSKALTGGLPPDFFSVLPLTSLYQGKFSGYTVYPMSLLPSPTSCRLRKQPECKYNPFRMLPAAEDVLQKALFVSQAVFRAWGASIKRIKKSP